MESDQPTNLILFEHIQKAQNHHFARTEIAKRNRRYKLNKLNEMGMRIAIYEIDHGKSANLSRIK